MDKAILMNLGVAFSYREESTWVSELIVMGLATLGLLPKALLEAKYFKDTKSARKTLAIWTVLIGTLGVSLYFSLLLNYFG